MERSKERTREQTKDRDWGIEEGILVEDSIKGAHTHTRVHAHALLLTILSLFFSSKALSIGRVTSRYMASLLLAAATLSSSRLSRRPRFLPSSSSEQSINSNGGIWWNCK